MPEAVRLGLCETTSNCGTGNGLPVGADHTTQRKQGKCFRTADECGDEADHHQNRTRLGRTTVQPSCREDPYGPPSGLSHRGPSCVRRSFRARLSSQSPQAPGKPLHGSHPAQWRLCSRVRQWRASFAPTQVSSHQAPWAARCAAPAHDAPHGLLPDVPGLTPTQARLARTPATMRQVATRRSTPDLLDANESTWAFVAIDRVGSVQKSEVRRLGALASEGR